MTFRQNYWQKVVSLSASQQAALIFAVALVVRIAVIALLRPYHTLDRFELERTALSLAATGVYGNPYAIPTGPTAHVSPGYTVILAALFHLFGTGTFAEIIKEVVASSVTALGCAVIPAAARALSMAPSTGLLAGLACALVPYKPLVQVEGDWEANYTAIFIALLCIAIEWYWRVQNLSIRSALYRGFLWGFALLFSSVLLPLFPVALIVGAWFFRHRSIGRYFRLCAIEIAVAALCLLPWIVRNQIALGSPIASRSNFGLEMRVSNNDEATPDQRVNYVLKVYDRYHPLQNIAEAVKVRDQGEVIYNRDRLSETKLWIVSHKSRFIALCAGRFVDFWLYPDPSRAKAWIGYATAVLGLIGVFFLMRADVYAGLLVFVILLCYPAPSYLIQVGARQRYPIDWLLTLLSVYAIQQIWSRYQTYRLPITTG